MAWPAAADGLARPIVSRGPRELGTVRASWSGARRSRLYPPRYPIEKPSGTRDDSLRLMLSYTEINCLATMGTIPGLWILTAAGRNGVGTGMLRSSGDGSYIAWQAPGSTQLGTPVHCNADGEYVLRDGLDPSKWLRARCYASYVRPYPMSAQVELSNVYNNAVGDDDVSAAEATAGDVKTYSVAMQNVSHRKLHQIKAWLDAETGELEISADGSSWVSPTTEAGALAMGALAVQAAATLYMKRTIAAGAAANATVLNELHLSFKGI